MGNNRNLVTLVVVLVVLGALYLITSQKREHLDETGGFRDVIEGTLSTDDVFGVRVWQGRNPDGGFDLAKRGDSWVMNSRFDAPANLNKIRTLLGNLESLDGEFRSDAASVLDDYALSDSLAYHLHVRGEDGQNLVELMIGKRSGAGCFIRQAGSNEVLLGSHNFLSDLGIWGDERGDPDAKSWIDLLAFSVERSDVRGIGLSQDGSRIVMDKEFPEPVAAEGDSVEAVEPDPESYEWRVSEPRNFLATKSRADGILNSLISLRARDVVLRGEAPAEYGLDESADQVLVRLEDGTQKVLLFGADMADEQGQFYFKVEGEDLVWSMPEYLKGNIFKSVDDLKME
jgi:hypothetical protein